MGKFAQGDKVVDIGILDVPGTILTAGEQVSLVRWVIHMDTYVPNDKLVLWQSTEHMALLEDTPNNIWHKALSREAPEYRPTECDSESLNTDPGNATEPPTKAPELTIASAPTAPPAAAPLRVSPFDVADLFKPEVPHDT